MRKSFNPFILLSFLVIVPFYWLYTLLGTVWFVMLALAGVCSITWYIKRLHRREEEDFQILVALTLQRKVPADKWKEINIALAHRNIRRSQTLRCIQILTESIDIALASKRPDIIESRFDTVIKEWNTVKIKFPDVLSDDNLKDLNEIVLSADERYQTVRYTNVARAHLEKADSLKTDKSKHKYRELAAEIIRDGMKNPRSNKCELEDIYKRIPDVAE